MSDQDQPDKNAGEQSTGAPVETDKAPSAEEMPTVRRRASADVTKKPAQAQQNSGGSGTGVLAIFLALVATGIASYPAYMTWQNANRTEPDQTAQRVQQLSDQLDQQSREITRVAEQQMALLDAPDTGQQYTDEKLAVMAAALAETMNAELQIIRDEFGTSSQDWLFAEVEYLIRMANQRALMERDSESALQLLTSADNIVRDAEGLTAHALREALALDIAALESVNQPDVQGIFLTLSAQIAQVSVLKRSMPVYQAPADPAVLPGPPANWSDRIQRVFTTAFGRLAELVDFRRGDIEIKPILPPAEEYYLRQNLVLKLQMAQLALLDGDTEVFQATVGDAATWVSDYFDEDDASTQAMARTLTALRDADVGVEVPDISRSLIAVRRQLENFRGETTR